MKQYWLAKTEPNTYSIDDLAREGTTEWYGIRNYQVRNTLRDAMRVGDEVLIYHSNVQPLGVVGIGRITSEAYADTQQFVKESPYFDPKSTQENPRWVSRDIAFVEKFPRIVTLAELQAEEVLQDMPVVKRGNRFSITPVTREEFIHIRSLAKK